MWFMKMSSTSKDKIRKFGPEEGIWSSKCLPPGSIWLLITPWTLALSILAANENS